MTHPLSGELRKLALEMDGYRDPGKDFPELIATPTALRRAADALDASEAMSRVRFEHAVRWQQERDELRRQLEQAHKDRIDVTEAARVGNATRMKLAGRAERAEARQIEQENLTLKYIKHLHKAEAQVARYREAIDQVMQADAFGDEPMFRVSLDSLFQTLREPETGGET